MVGSVCRSSGRPVLVAIAAAVIAWPAPAAMPYRHFPGAAVQQTPQVDLPQARPCALAPPPAPYQHPYSRQNISGALDDFMVGDAIEGTVSDLYAVASDLQARLELVRCETGNSASELVALPASATDCPPTPPEPYRPEGYPAVEQGANPPGPVHMLQAASSYGLYASEALSDLQGRIEQLRCSERRLEGPLAQRYQSATLRPLPPSPCRRPEPSPTYAETFPNVVPTFTNYFGLTIRRLNENQGDIDHWLEDLQSRIEEVGCEQDYLLDSANRLTGAPGVAQGEGRSGPGAGQIDEPGLSPGLKARGGSGGFDAPPSLRSQLSQPPRSRQDNVCRDEPPQPSYVQRHNQLGCDNGGVQVNGRDVPKGECQPWDAEVARLLVLLREHNERVGDDLQSRLNRVDCQQQAIDAALAPAFPPAR